MTPSQSPATTRPASSLGTYFLTESRLRRNSTHYYPIKDINSKYSVSLLAAIAGCLCLATQAQAANPAEGTVTPSTTTPVTWDGTATGTGGTDETSATEGVNRDTFVLHVAAGDYSTKTIAVKIEWTDPGTDYDLYIHKRNADGTDGEFVSNSTGGAPSTSENTSINPSTTGTGDFNIIIVYFTNVPGVDQPHGTVEVINAPALRTASYISGGMTFAPNSTVKAQTATRDGEPSSRVDTQGNYYVGGIRGVPAGVDLWYFRSARVYRRVAESEFRSKDAGANLSRSA